MFLIVGENTGYKPITAAHAPSLASRLKPSGTWLTGYRSLAGSGSLGQYVATLSGRFAPCEARNDPPDHCHQRVPSLFAQLQASGRG